MKFSSMGVAGVLAVGLLSAPAFAFSKGNVGYSGKQGASVTCNLCHMNGDTPTVTLTGPTSLEAGATGQYTLTIKGGAGVKGGMNVAVDSSAAMLQIGDGSMQVLNGELTHTGPKDFVAGQVTFDFSMVAPSTAGSIKLYAAGNSVNGDGNSTLDKCATTTLDVAVTAPAPAPATPSEPEKAAGCSALGDSPMLLSVLAAAGVLRLRRRRG